MEIGTVISGIRAAVSGFRAVLSAKSAFSTPAVKFFFAIGEGYGYTTPLSRKHYLDEINTFETSGRWLAINIEIANGTQRDVSIQGMAIHAGKSVVPLKNITFGGKVMPHRLLSNQTEYWTVSIKELSRATNTLPTDFDKWPDLHLVVKLGNGKSVRARPSISNKDWKSVVAAWKATLA